MSAAFYIFNAVSAYSFPRPECSAAVHCRSTRQSTSRRFVVQTLPMSSFIVLFFFFFFFFFDARAVYAAAHDCACRARALPPLFAVCRVLPCRHGAASARRRDAGLALRRELPLCRHYCCQRCALRFTPCLFDLTQSAHAAVRGASAYAQRSIPIRFFASAEAHICPTILPPESFAKTMPPISRTIQHARCRPVASSSYSFFYIMRRRCERYALSRFFRFRKTECHDVCFADAPLLLCPYRRLPLLRPPCPSIPPDHPFTA